MLYDYILTNFDKGEPFFLYELPGNSADYIRQEVKKLSDDGKIERIYNGAYFLPYLTILGTKGKPSIEKFIEKKYLLKDGEVSGFTCGIQLANSYGFTSQNPSYHEVCTNVATTKQRKFSVGGQNILIYKPVTAITAENQKALQFLDLMTSIDRYSELSNDELHSKLLSYIDCVGIDFRIVKEYISLFPDKVYRNIYQGGLMHELV